MDRRFTSLISLFAVLFTLAVPINANAQAVGVSAGANFNALSDIEADDRRATLDNVTGWHVHLWFDMPMGPIAIRPGIRYMDAGRVFQPSETEGFGDEFTTDDQVVTFLEVPIDLRFRMTLPVVTPYVAAGPVLRFATDTNNEDRLENFSLAAGAGVGLEIGIAGVRFFPEVKYTFGVTRFTSEEYEIGNVTVSPDEDQRLNALMLSLGVAF